MKLTKAQHDLLASAATRPNGFLVRGEESKRLLLELSALTLVCDPHEMGSAYFTRITDLGRSPLSQESATSRGDRG